MNKRVIKFFTIFSSLLLTGSACLEYGSRPFAVTFYGIALLMICGAPFFLSED